MNHIPNIIISASLLLVPALHAESPDRLADPEALRKQVERLAAQDPWTKFATPEQVGLFSGPETVWPQVEISDHDLSGFDRSILGGEVPPPGVHPRILFNQEDIPAIRERLFSTAEGERRFALTEHILKNTMLDPERPDGEVFAQLAENRLDGLTFGDPSKGPNGSHQFVDKGAQIYSAHVCYWPRNLAALAFYALIKDDAELSKRVGTAVHNYYVLREPHIDAQNALGDDPNARNARPADLWRGMHHVAGESHLGIGYDLTARYMSEEQKADMRRIITKATVGKRSSAANGPLRWRDTNWVGWDTQHLLCHLAIEGEEGFDPEVYAAGRDTVRAYLDFGINEHGTIFETNGKNGAGIHFALTSAVALARRGDNFLGHPHLRKMSVSQVHQVVPAGGKNVNNGTFGGAPFGQAGFLKNLYPGDAAADWLIQEGRPLDASATFDAAAYQELLDTRKINWNREHPLTAEGFLNFAGYTGAKNDDGKPKATWERDYLKLPLDFADPVHGQLATRSSNDKDALFFFIEARPDLYTVGHQHHDAGHFYLSADGVNWGIESANAVRDSKVHSVVMIDGLGQGDTQHCAPAKAGWLGDVVTEDAAFAITDLKNAYDSIWTTPMHYSWNNEERMGYKWEPVTDPETVKIFAGTQHHKVRIWSQSYWDNNWGPTMRADYNPVEHAFRTAGLVRGEHPYALVVDDIRKDASEHSYEWQMQVPNDARLVSSNEDGVLLGIGDERKPGEPLLWVKSLGAGPSAAGAKLEPVDLENVKGQRLVLATIGSSAQFRVLLVPVRSGEDLPVCTMAADAQIATLAWPGQSDVFTFSAGPDARTRLAITRGDNTLLEIK